MICVKAVDRFVQAANAVAMMIALSVGMGCSENPPAEPAPSVPLSRGRVAPKSAAGSSSAYLPQVLSAGDLSADKIPGYRHTFANSRFAVGATAAVEDKGGVRRYTGEDGVFLEWTNGFAHGIPNATASSKAAAPLSYDSATHSARTLAYFKAGGLPQDQIGDVAITTLIKQTGEVATGKQLSRELLGYTTVIHRKIDEVLVAESVAWARFNINDDVVAEQVWWPELPPSLHDEISQFKAVLADPAQEVALRSKLPPAVAGKSGALAVHHARPVGQAWYLGVTLDITAGSRTFSFDRFGAERRYLAAPELPSDAKP